MDTLDAIDYIDIKLPSWNSVNHTFPVCCNAFP